MDNDDLQACYDDLINAIFEATYDDLVGAYIRERKVRERLRNADSESKRHDAGFDLQGALCKIDFYANWLREVLPQWRDLDPDRIIVRAKEVADEMQ